jgi:hypothetical protein
MRESIRRRRPGPTGLDRPPTAGRGRRVRGTGKAHGELRRLRAEVRGSRWTRSSLISPARPRSTIGVRSSHRSGARTTTTPPIDAALCASDVIPTRLTWLAIDHGVTSPSGAPSEIASAMLDTPKPATETSETTATWSLTSSRTQELHIRDDATSVRCSRHLHDDVDHGSHVGKDLLTSEAVPRLKHHERQLLEGARRRVGVQRRERARMPRIDGAQAGYGVRICTVVQRLGQLDDLYGRAGREAILQNSALQVVFAANDEMTARYVSERLGTQTVQTVSRSVRGGGLATKHYGSTARPLLLPEEVRELGAEEAILFKEGARAIRARKIRYYRERAFTERRRGAIPVPEVSLDGDRQHGLTGERPLLENPRA